MKKILLTFAALATVSVSFAQDMKIFKAEEMMEKKEYKEALAVIEEVIANPKTKKLALAYFLAGEIEGRVINDEIEKLKAGKGDAKLFYETLDKAVSYFEKSSEIDHQPDNKGRVKPKYAKKFENGVVPYPGYKKRMKDMLPYYAYAGSYLNQNKDQDNAFNAFVKYLDLPKSPVFGKNESDSIYKKGAAGYRKIGYYAAMLAYQKEDFDNVLKYSDWAIADTTKTTREDGYMMKLKALLAKGDTAQWVETSKKAIQDCPDNINNVLNLLGYYENHKMTQEAQAMADDLVKQAPENKMAWYARGCVFMSRNYEEAHKAFAKAIEIDPNFARAHFNQGITYVNELTSIKDQLTTDRTQVDKYNADMAKARGYYRNALPFFENALVLAPNRPNMWGYNLQTVYYNLQDGAQKEEMKNKEADMKKVVDGSMTAEDFISKYNITKK